MCHCHSRMAPPTGGYSEMTMNRPDHTSAKKDDLPSRNWSSSRRVILLISATTALTILPATDLAATTPTTQMMPAGSTDAQQDTGLFDTKGDNVHISKASPRAASAHGWWTLRPGLGKPPTHADATVRLQIMRNDGRWVNAGEPGSERVRPGGGAANRASARVVCTSSKSSWWRSIVDVNIVGYADSPNQITTKQTQLPCRV